MNITVTVDGIVEEVNFGEGGNVELRTPQNPDPPTGCPGLKFDFGLDKVNGEMSFCFELITPYAIGPNAVCLFGGGMAGKGLSICGPICEEASDCQTSFYQPVTVCVPVTITPYVNSGPIVVNCYGDPIVTPGINTCDGTENGSCSFTITQNLGVLVPVDFGCTTSTGNPFVQCGQPTDEEVAE